MPDTHFEELLARQLVMNGATWAALRKHGVTEQSELRLDFSYYAPSRESAAALQTLLQEQTDYDVQIKSNGSLLRRRWRVEGSTQQTTISPTSLDRSHGKRLSHQA